MHEMLHIPGSLHRATPLPTLLIMQFSLCPQRGVSNVNVPLQGAATSPFACKSGIIHPKPHTKANIFHQVLNHIAVLKRQDRKLDMVPQSAIYPSLRNKVVLITGGAEGMIGCL